MKPKPPDDGLTAVEVTVNIEPFRLPNFVTFEGLGKQGKISVGELTDDEAEAYWSWMKVKWLAHVKARRELAV